MRYDLFLYVRRTVPPISVGFLLLAALSTLVLSPHPALADSNTLFVRTDGTGTDCTQNHPCALQASLDRATDGDTIYVAQGTYTSSGNEVIRITESITLYGGWNGSPNGTIVCDPGVYPTILDGQDQRRVVYISGTISPTIDGFTITRGNADQSPNGAYGGGIYVWQASPTIQHNVIRDNVAGRNGGGIYSSGSTSRILDNIIRDNVSGRNGGGIYSENWDKSLIQGNLISNNVIGAGWHGGGIWIGYRGSMPTIRANHILSNTANDSAGIGIAGSSRYTVTNNVIARNNGGGIRLWDDTGEGIIAHNTIAYNTGKPGLRLNYAENRPTAVNNIIVANPIGIIAHKDATATLDYNDVWGNTTLDYNLPGALTPGSHSISADPRFVNPSGDDYHLRAVSLCIDRATDTGVTTDIDGHPRPFGPAPDIGAYEADERLPPVAYLPLSLRQ